MPKLLRAFIHVVLLAVSFVAVAVCAGRFATANTPILEAPPPPPPGPDCHLECRIVCAEELP